MKMEPELPARDPVIEAAAADWIVQHDRGLTAQQQDDFFQWQSAKPAHRESFDRHRRMWSDFNALTQWRPEHSSAPNPDLLARPQKSRSWRRWLPVPLAAAAAITLAAVWAVTEPWGAPQTLSLTASHYRQETLPDGSVLELNRGAHVVVQFSSAERRVLLVEGEALFTVAKNPARPFIVRSVGVDVRAVGTAFNVKLVGPKLEVLVTEGTVKVSRSALSQNTESQPEVASESRPQLLATVRAGERTVVGLSEVMVPPRVISVSPQEVAELLDWQPRLLDFNSEPLAEVVAIFNRRNSSHLIIGDESLRSLPIIASIRSDNIGGLIRQLEATMGIRAERQLDGAIVLRRDH